MRDTEYAIDEDADIIPVELRFRHHGDTLTLWLEKLFDDDWVLGYCPELKQNMLVNPANVIP